MKCISEAVRGRIHMKSLRSYAACMFTGVTALALAVSSVFFYAQTARVLRETYQEQMFRQLNSTLNQVSEQVDLIDSLYLLFMSNNLIYDNLETTAAKGAGTAAIERQMTYLLITNYAWEENFIESVSIYTGNGDTYRVSIVDSARDAEQSRSIYRDMDRKYPFLRIVPDPGNDGSLYFVRNIFSSSTGQPIAAMIISIDGRTWINYLGSALDNDWFVFLYNDDFELSSMPEQDMPFHADDYLTVSEKIDSLDLSAIVVAPRSELRQKLSSALGVYLAVIFAVSAAALLAAYALSRAFTYPVMRMIRYVDRISEGHYSEDIPATEVYEEFNSLIAAFNHMLKEINAYHADNLEKQMLLKNAEIQALQSQINPHFLFNTLNTLAWKAQMSDNQELYQMAISLGEFLKTNILSKSSSFITLEQEIKCVRFYIYLQKMRFEDKISAGFDLSPGLQKLRIPCFCLQSLVENSFEHGLEPKKGNGELIVTIQKQGTFVLFSVRDNGIGFRGIPDLGSPSTPAEGSHTHIGLRNLDRRLFLLYGEDSRLQIESIPDVRTVVSFRIPYTEECAL